MFDNEKVARNTDYDRAIENQRAQACISGQILGAGVGNQAMGFTEAPRLSFSYALDWLKAGRRVSRRGWNGNGIFLELQTPDANSKMSAPYIFIDTTGLRSDNPAAPRVRVPWVASQTDLLADDWQQA